MRRNLVLVFLFILGTLTVAHAQRPWAFAYPANLGPTANIDRAASTLFLFADKSLSSYNHGVLWDTILTLPGNVRGLTEIPGLLTIAVVQDTPQDPFHGFFTQNGTVWTAFDTIPNEGKTATHVASKGLSYYIATNSNVIFKRETSTSQLVVSGGDGISIKRIVLTPEIMMVLVEGGSALVSLDEGTTWTVQMDGLPPTGSPLSPLKDIQNISGRIIGNTVAGLVNYNTTTQMWEQIGVWPEIGTPHVYASSGDDRRYVAIVGVADRYQMYRLETGDSIWIETGYPLPGKNLQPTKLQCVLDEGWVAAYYVPTDLKDSAGVYNYNLDDFTGVQETLRTTLIVLSTENGLRITSEVLTGGTVSVHTVLGQEILTLNVESLADVSIDLPANLSGVLAVVVHPTDLASTGRVIVK